MHTTVKPPPNRKKRTRASVLRLPHQVEFSAAAKQELRRICPAATFLERLQFPLQVTAARKIRADEFPGVSGKAVTRFLQNLENAAKALLDLLEVKESDPAITPTFAEELLMSDRPLIHDLRENLKAFREALPEAYKEQAQLSRLLRQDLNAQELVVMVQRVFYRHGLPTSGKHSKVQQCLLRIFNEAGDPKTKDAISQLISRTKKKQKRLQ